MFCFEILNLLLLLFELDLILLNNIIDFAILLFDRVIINVENFEIAIVTLFRFFLSLFRFSRRCFSRFHVILLTIILLISLLTKFFLIRLI